MTPIELRKWLEVNKMAVSHLAKLIHVDRKTIYRWANGAVALPADLANCLAGALALQDTTIAAEERYAPTCPIGYIPESETPHGQVIGLKNSFWRQPEPQRIEWIMADKYPLRALPWPLWTPGWSYWPPSQFFPERYPDKDKMPPPARAEPHWLASHVINELDRDNIRKSTVTLCRKYHPTWFAKKPVEVSEDMLADIMEMSSGIE